MTKLIPADIEIVERPLDKPSDGAPVIPQQVRINGVQLMTSRDFPVVVHEMNLTDQDAVYVTVTFLARRVRVGFADEIAGPTS